MSKFFILFSIIGLFIAFSVQADPQISIQNGGYCHAPWDAANTDNEWKIMCVGFIDEDDDTQTAYGYSLTTQKFPAGQVSPSSITYLDTVNAGDATACTLTNDDGTTYTSTDWTVTVVREVRGNNGNGNDKSNGNVDSGETQFIVECLNAAKQD